MADMITRCPRCGTAFRITPAHLRSAKGSARCGSCLQVFNAKENLTPESLAALAATEATTAPAHDYDRVPTSPPQPAEPDSDDLLISDDMEAQFEDGDTEDDAYVHEEPTQTSLFERISNNREDDEDKEDSDDDESWALKLLDEDDPTPAPSKGTSARAVAADTSEVNVEREELADQDYGDDEAAVQVPDDDEPLDASEFAYPGPGAADADAGTRAGFSGSAYLDAIEPEPVEFAFRKEKPFWQSRMLWTGLCVLAAALLLGQIAWLQYPTLNRTEPYRSFYAAACNIIGCELPPQQDLAAIRTSNLVVRSHPRVEDALMVDVILQNTASFPQTFPELLLTFSDLRGNTVAQRRFAPEEYLGGELLGQEFMPVRQPIHIALEIVDPGPNAINYRVEIVDDTE